MAQATQTRARLEPTGGSRMRRATHRGGLPLPAATKLLRLATLPETRHVLMAAARSDSLRRVAHRARTDRAGLARELRDPAVIARLARDAIVHPATREIATLGLVLLPDGYLPLWWVATRMSRRLRRRPAASPKV